MRWSTLVLPVTLLYSLSFVNAIPHEADEKRYWLHKRQDLTGSSSPASVVQTPSASSPAVSQSTLQNSISSGPSSSLSSVPSSSTALQPSSNLPASSSTSTDSIATSLSSSSSSTNTGTRVLPSTTTTNRPDSQVTTSNRHFSSTVSISGASSSSDGSSETGSSSGTSFLKNKGAMGSVFAIVGLIGAAIIVGAVFFVIKRIRQRKDEEEFDAYFEKLPANNSNNASNRNIGGNDFGLGPSATDLTAPVNSQAYVSRDVHYGSTSQYPNQPANHIGFEYPPERGSIIERPASFAQGTAYAAAMGQRGQYCYEGQVEDPNSVPNHPFADPDNRRY